MRSFDSSASLMLPVTVALLAVNAGVAHAQVQATDKATVRGTNQQSTKEPDNLQEIVVTAQRRRQLLSNVPIDVSAYTQDTLDAIGAHNVEDIARTTPGIIVQPGFDGTTSIAIRGISSTVGAGTTGIYINDTPIQVRALGAGGAATSAFPAIFDLARVEILRGPQGTLFGSGSEGGTIRFITPSPSLNRTKIYGKSEIATTENGDPSYELGVAVGAPIVTHKLGFRISAYERRDGGWIDQMPYPGNVVTHRNINAKTTYVFNAALAFKPIDTLTITPAVYYQREHVGNTQQYWPQLSDPSAERFVTGQLLAQPQTDAFTLPSLKIEWDMPAATVISDTSYFHRSRDVITDYSFIDTDVLSGNYTNPTSPAPTTLNNPQQTFTQEIRVQSNDAKSRVRWLVGAFYQVNDQQAVQIVREPGLSQVTQALFGLTTLQTFGVGLYQGTIAYQGLDTSEDQQIAVFGNVTLKLTKTLDLSAGLRVARMKFSFTNSQNGPFNGGPSSGTGSASETPVSPKISLNYRPTDKWLIYTSAAKGFRPGGANTPVSAQTCAADLHSLGLSKAPSIYRSDSLWSYELGSKLRSSDNRLQLDGSVFYVDWKNVQSLVPLLHCGFQFVGNLGDAVSKGFDLEGSVIALGSLKLHLGIGYTDARYSKSVYVAPGVPLVTNGDHLDAAPWHVSLIMDYVRTVLGDRTAYLHLQYNYNSGFSLQNSHNVTYDPLANHYYATRIASVRAGLKFGDWDASVFADNVLNSHDITSFFHDVPTSTLLLDTAFRPRTVGVTVTYRY